MRKSLRGVALAAGLAVAAAGRADAQWSWSGCGGSTFNTCASVNISLSGSVLTITVQNWGNYNQNTNSIATFSGSPIFTALGIGNFGSGSLALSGTGTCIGDATCSWQDGTQGLPEIDDGAVAQPPPDSNGLNPPASPGAGQFTQVILVFNTTGIVDLSSATFALHGQAGPLNLATTDPADRCGTKLIVTKSGTTYTPNSADATSSAGCDVSTPVNPPTETPVPEPASMVLLATGLVAMGGIGVIRRRRNRKV